MAVNLAHNANTSLSNVNLPLANVNLQFLPCIETHVNMLATAGH